jgi:beta-mannosidase
MTQRHDLAALSWQLSGLTPESWHVGRSMEIDINLPPEVPTIPARVPGSVQGALRAADVLPDWNVAMNHRLCDWVENRDWVFETQLPDDWCRGRRVVLRCDGLDGPGYVALNNELVGSFDSAFRPWSFDLTQMLAATDNRLQIVFEPPARWLGQVGRTSQMTTWKPRFNYTWDWCPRLVQIGIWDAIALEVSDGPTLASLRVVPDGDAASQTGTLRVAAEVQAGDGCHLELTLRDAEEGWTVGTWTLSPDELGGDGKRFDGLDVSLWWPNGEGAQPLYELTCRLLDRDGRCHDTAVRRVGFRHVTWQPCAEAPPEADPWICTVNGRGVFMQGVNWTPIRPNFADVTEDELRRRLELYRDMGCNILRVWGGAVLESSRFYALCDRLGLMVWQEFPLSSSGRENWPPEDDRSIADLTLVAKSYIARRQHHPSLILWCGGNELQGSLDGGKQGVGKPVDLTHPLMQRLQEVVQRDDPTRRFIPTSSCGPRFTAEADDFGKGLHWDVHGPWRAIGSTESEHQQYWENDDALLRSEAGCPGASDTALIERYAGELEPYPPTLDNPLWRRTSWWLQWEDFLDKHDREPESLEEYVQWSQRHQAWALSVAAAACKGRFPRCAGFIVWMGHDCFPCTANTAIIDFHGSPKPAYHALSEVFHEPCKPA